MITPDTQHHETIVPLAGAAITSAVLWAKLLAAKLRARKNQQRKDKTLPVKQQGLGPLFLRSDYPPAEDMRKLFGVEWYPLMLAVPDNIPDDVKAEASEKFKQRLSNAAADIEKALRSELQELLAHAEERLTVLPGQKPKVFRESLLGNLTDFIETFDSKNVFKDRRLATVVCATKAALLDDEGKPRMTTAKLREYASVREVAKKKFSELRTVMDSMLEEKVERRFNFDD